MKNQVRQVIRKLLNILNNFEAVQFKRVIGRYITVKRAYIPFVYIAFDLAGSAAAWLLFSVAAEGNTISGISFSGSFLKGLLIVPASWFVLFLLTGFYDVSLKRSRLFELYYSLILTLGGVIVTWFILVGTGHIDDNSQFFRLFMILFLYQFGFTYFPRLLITSSTARKVHKGLLGYRTLIVGSNGKAFELYMRIVGEKIRSGNILCGYVSINGTQSGLFGTMIPCLGAVSDLPSIIRNHNIEEVIIAIEGNEFPSIGEITGMLNYSDVTIKAIPSLKDILTGRVEQSAIFSTPLLEVSNKPMKAWQANLKTIFDYFFSILSLIILLPLIAVLVLMIRMSGNGPVIYSQERTGKNGRPFKIYKFRSMYPGSEGDTPLLSSASDSRVTAVGKFMRRHRLDEIPNLINVLKGDMSLVGPRPERAFFINQIVEKAPHFRRLHKVKPGITSWGQVKYGYASNVDQMIERLEFDLIYVENMSLIIDLKIMIYTFLIIVRGKGV